MNISTNDEFKLELNDEYMNTMLQDPHEDYRVTFRGKEGFRSQDDINYAFNEKALLEEMQSYIDKTYDAHYSQNKYQSTEIIEDMGHGMGFALGNVIKYCQRYGKKEGFNRDDLKKVIHYGIIALAMHDRKHEDKFEYPLEGQD